MHDSDVEAIYRPLKSATATRCARFDVDKFARTGKLHCLLEEVDLKRKPLEYAAISYTSIGSCGRRLINVEGHGFYVTANCRAALSASITFNLAGGDEETSTLFGGPMLHLG